ncbi:Betaine aldehyde dehydrogenase 2 [Balamuthia mandrillaris]
MKWPSLLFIDGKWRQPQQGRTMPVVNPATEERFHSVSLATAEDVDAAVLSAKNALQGGKGGWAGSSGKERAELLREIAGKMEEAKERMARTESLDCGKPLKEARADVDDAVKCIQYYATLAEKLDEEQDANIPVPDSDFTTTIRKEPVGVVAAITPFNFPLLMAVQKMAPALAAGCTIVIKPSELTSLSTLLLAEIIQQTKLPEGVVNVLTGDGPTTGAPLVNHPDVDKVSFTGSLRTGSSIMSAAAADIKKVSLELGGKSPMLVFDDVQDIDAVVEWIMFGIFWNQGQVCSATSRVMVQEGIADELIERLIEKTKVINIGDPLTTPNPCMGPLISETQYKKVLNYVEEAKRGSNARLIAGGERPPHLQNGYFLQPTIFRDVDTSSKLWKEEIFGPVLCVRTFKDEQEAIAEANNTEYGLGAAVMSADNDRCKRVVRAFKAGVVWVNCSQPVFFEAPWGGMKRSGLGRELGPWGLDAFLEVKQVTTWKGQQWGWYAS